MSLSANLLGYIASTSIILAYLFSIRSGRHEVLHWANALGGIPLLAVEISTGAWPVLPLTLAFTLLGAYGARKDVTKRLRERVH